MRLPTTVGTGTKGHPTLTGIFPILQKNAPRIEHQQRGKDTARVAGDVDWYRTAIYPVIPIAWMRAIASGFRFDLIPSRGNGTSVIITDDKFAGLNGKGGAFAVGQNRRLRHAKVERSPV